MSTMLNSHRLPSAHPVPDVNLATLPMKQSHRVDAVEAVYIDGVHKPFSNIKKYNALTTKDITDSKGCLTTSLREQVCPRDCNRSKIVRINRPTLKLN
jgi:hypothetical protein